MIAISKAGKTIRVDVNKLRHLKRSAQGVRLMKLDNSDQVASMIIIDKDQQDLQDNKSNNG